MGLSDVLNILTLVGVVAAVLLARRKSRERLSKVRSEAYASGMRDFSARVGASVVVGDVTRVSADGATSYDQRSVNYHDQRRRDNFDIGPIEHSTPIQRAVGGLGVCSAGIESGSDRLRELPGAGRVSRGHRRLRLAPSAVRRRVAGADDAALTAALAVELGVDPVDVLDTDEALSIMRSMRDSGQRLVVDDPDEFLF